MRDRELEKRIAAERIRLLLDRAVSVSPTDAELARRYVSLARRIGMRAGVRIPRTKKRFICKGCGSPLMPGRNCRVRMRAHESPAVVITCLECGALKRYPISKGRSSPEVAKV